MGRIIAIANQKGGVGKTTTAINLSASLASMNKKVLALDMDPQGNTTSGLGVDRNIQENTVYELLIGECMIDECIVHTDIEGLDLIPSNINLSGAEIELIGIERKEYILKEAIEKVKENYDKIIIDCPPSLGLITLNAFTASDSVLIPVQCEYYALEGLTQLLNTILLTQKVFNENLTIEGVLLTMLDARTNLGVEVSQEVRKYFREKVYDVVIPRNIKLSEAPSEGLNIFDYDAHSEGAKAYAKLAKEVVKRNGRK